MGGGGNRKLSRKTNATDRARAAFLALLADSCNVTESARAAGISRATAYRWREDDPAFAAAWAEAEETAVDALVQAAWERARSGQSDRMLEILIKGHRPKYRDKQAVELTGRDGGPIEYREAAEQEIAELFGPTPHLMIEHKHG